MFTHYLITRFNLQLSGLQPETIESPVFDDDWLKSRLYYFTTYCAPAVLAQTNHNFQWIVYFHPLTPAWVLDQIEPYKHHLIPVEYVFVRDYPAMLADLRQRIDNARTPYVLTSRLDNDDVIGRDFVQDVQSHFIPQPLTLINFLSGFEWHPNQQVIKRWNVRPRNQFMSLIESKGAKEIITIYGFPHWRPPEAAQIIDIPSKPAWVYIRHEKNFSMDKRNAIPEFRINQLSKLSPVFSDRKISVWQSINYTIRWIPKMLVRRIKQRLSRSGK